MELSLSEFLVLSFIVVIFVYVFTLAYYISRNEDDINFCPFELDRDYWAIRKIYGDFAVVPVVCYEIHEMESAVRTSGWEAKFINLNSDSNTEFSVKHMDKILVFETKDEAKEELTRMKLALKFSPDVKVLDL